jgi:catechol 2,3-dioxygenase-like lactoylglutathione lyase family enzyme
MEHGGRWVHLAMSRQPQVLELNFYPRTNRFYEPFHTGTELDHLGFFVKDIDTWVRRAQRLGGKVTVDFSETHERLAYVRDPDGIWIEFVGKPLGRTGR